MTAIRRFVFSRLLALGRVSRSVEFIELSAVPGQSPRGEARAPVFVLVSGAGGRHLYLCLDDGSGPPQPLPGWWQRLGDLGHPQRFIRSTSALEAWDMTRASLRRFGLVSG